MMVEWHLSPDYIVNNWTDELLDVMVDKLVERKRRESDVARGYSTKSSSNKVSDTALFSRARNLIKVVKE